MPAQEQNHHPLEGKVLVWQYTEQEDRDIGEHSGIFLARLKSSKLETIYNARDHVVWGSEEMGDEQNKQALNKLRKLRVSEVYSVFHLEDFFGIHPGWFGTESEELAAEKRRLYGKNAECDQWVEYARVDELTDTYRFLTDNGITVIDFDNTPYEKPFDSRKSRKEK